MKEGTKFELSRRTKYEALPFTEGLYKVVHCGDYDGEYVHVGQNSETVDCVRLDSHGHYVKDKKVYSFTRKILQEYVEDGYLTITEYETKTP